MLVDHSNRIIVTRPTRPSRVGGHERAPAPGRLSRNPLSAERLLQVTGVCEDAFDRSVDTHVPRLRRKLGVDPCASHIIRIERGFGYVFALSVETCDDFHPSRSLLMEELPRIACWARSCARWQDAPCRRRSCQRHAA